MQHFLLGVILAIDEKCASLDEDRRTDYIRFIDNDNPTNNITFDKIAKVIDVS